MSFASRHDYQFYEQTVSGPKLEQMRALTAEAKFDLYADFFDTVLEAAETDTSEKALKIALRQKMAVRRRLLRAFLTKD